MIEIKVYRMLQDCRIELTIYGPGGEVGTKVNWQGAVDEDDVLADISHHLANALSAADRLEGDVHQELLFGS